MVDLGTCRAYYRWVWQQLELLDHKPLRVHDNGRSRGHVWQLSAQLVQQRCVPWVPSWLQSPVHKRVDICPDRAFLRTEESCLMASLPLPSHPVLLRKHSSCLTHPNPLTRLSPALLCLSHLTRASLFREFSQTSHAEAAFSSPYPICVC